MDVFILVLACVGGVWGLLTLLGLWFTDKRCVGCRYWGDENYMLRGKDGKYWHIGCMPLKNPSQDPPFFQ